jgi:hypothetical protein
MPTDRPETGANQRRAEEAFRLLGMAAVRMAIDPNPSAYVLDFASRDGILQEAWCREELSATTIAGPGPTPADISSGAVGPVNAARYLRAQQALSDLLAELSRPGYNGSASLRLRGHDGEMDDDIRAESRRQWRF